MCWPAWVFGRGNVGWNGVEIISSGDVESLILRKENDDMTKGLALSHD